MGDILNGNSFIHAVTKHNIAQVIAEAQPELMSPNSYRKMAGHFTETFRQESFSQRETVGGHELSGVYSHAANVLDKIVGQQSLSRTAHKNHALCSFLYFRNDDFRLFLDKFLPDFLICETAKDHPKYQPPEAEEGKIVPFLSHTARANQVQSDSLHTRQ